MHKSHGTINDKISLFHIYNIECISLLKRQVTLHAINKKTKLLMIALLIEHFPSLHREGHLKLRLLFVIPNPFKF